MNIVENTGLLIDLGKIYFLDCYIRQNWFNMFYQEFFIQTIIFENFLKLIKIKLAV